MHGDDFDRRRTGKQPETDPLVERPRVPGKQTLVEAEQGRRQDTPGVPGKRTLVQDLDEGTQGLANTRDPVTETEFQVRKAREAIAKLAAQPPPIEARVLVADLHCHLDAATKSAQLAVSQPGGREVTASVFALIAEAQPYLRVTASAERPTTDPGGADPVTVARRGIAGPGQRLPHHDVVQPLFGAHDISGIRAHVGGAAADASHELGAQAYAHGDDIAFADHPTLHLAAHEAAHVVQQRTGVAYKRDEPDDAYEQHADLVADTVVRGESAAALLDAGPRGGAITPSVQRKPKGESAPAAQDDGPQTTKAPHAKWPVFSENGLPYQIVSPRDPVRFWTVSDWIRAGEGFRANGTHAVSPACAAQILGALGWVRKDRIAFAAKHVVFDISRRVAASEVSATGFYYTGLPSSAPVVTRATKDVVYVATQLGDPDVPDGTPIEVDDAQRQQVIRALAAFTGLAPAADALANLRNSASLRELVVQSGVLVWTIDPVTGDGIFGFDQASDDRLPYTRWLYSKQDRKPATPEQTKKLALHDYYGEPIPGTLVVDRDLIEAGQPAWLEVEVNWPKNYPNAKDYDVVPMVTPGHRGNVALLHCDWKIELVGAGGATTATTPAAPAAASPPSAGMPLPADASAGATSHTDVAEHHHMFALPPGQASGTFRVTVRASFDAYFEPAEFTKTVEVRSTAAAMKQLGDAAFADLGARETSRTPESFDASGSGDDNHGYQTSGQLPASFKPSTLDGPDPRAAAREDERLRLEATRVYLEANGARADVLAAVDREIDASRATESALASDRNRGWQPFQIRGTYLSREDGVPSGPLTLYGSVHAGTEAGEKIHGSQQTPDRGVVVVQIRDLSRRFDNQDLTFTGSGDTFETALKAAFTDNAKAYPKGVMAIEAEAIETHVSGSAASIGKGNGKTVGFELGTDSRWKRVNAAVWDPLVNIATNLGAMALMAFVPGSAVVVAPLLITYNSVPAIDRLRTEAARGTLTAGGVATSVGEIALNLLPLAGRAPSFTREWFLIEGANWGGQAVLMTASAIQTARALQSQDVEALATMYDELQTLELSHADPAAIEQKRQAVMKRAKEVSDRIEEALGDQIATNAMFAVAGSVIHNAGTEYQRGSVIDAYLNARGGGQGEDASAAKTASAASEPRGEGSTANKGSPPAGASAESTDNNSESGRTRSQTGRDGGVGDGGASADSVANDEATRTDKTATAGERADHTHLSARDGAPSAATKKGLVDALAKSKALAEQHAHADGSVPISSVLVESPDVTIESRAKQIADLKKILDEVAQEAAKEAAKGKTPVSPAISDLRPGHRIETDGTVSPQDKVTLVAIESALVDEKGLVQRLYDAKVNLQHELQQPHPDHERVLALTENVQIALRSYREHLVMRKPNYARYAEDVQTGAEFFRRYKMITGHNLSPREIADTRSSAGQLAAQELRVSIGGDSMKDIAALKEVAKDFNDANDEARGAGDQADVSLIVNSTKNKSGKAAHAEEMARLIDAWAGDSDLQRAVSGLDNAGVESADLPPSKLWKMSAKRAFMNAERVKLELGTSVPPNQREAFVESLARVLGGDQAQARVVLERFESFDFSAAMSAVDARPAGDSIAVTETGVVTEAFAGMTMEEAATTTRRIVDALRARRAEMGDARELPRLLGYTVHAGEQLKDVDAFELLKQVEESINLGADRIGHGLILTIDAHELVKMGRLPESRLSEFVARQQQVRDHAKRAAVTIEMNITSNTEISNLAADQHPTATMVKSGLRVSVSTDDETTLGTTVKDELRRLAAAPGTSRTDVAIVILEGFYSRMGARPLADRARLRSEYLNTLTQGLNANELESLAHALSNRFHTAPVEGDPRATIDRALAAVFGTGG